MASNAKTGNKLYGVTFSKIQYFSMVVIIECNETAGKQIMNLNGVNCKIRKTMNSDQ